MLGLPTIAEAAKRLRLASTPLLPEGTPVVYTDDTNHSHRAVVIVANHNNPFFDYAIYIGTLNEYRNSDMLARRTQSLRLVEYTAVVPV